MNPDKSAPSELADQGFALFDMTYLSEYLW